MRDYHDREWGVPVHDDRLLFEFLVLEGAQAGLSWSTILNKRDNYRRAFARFDPEKVARLKRLARSVQRRSGKPVRVELVEITGPAWWPPAQALRRFASPTIRFRRLASSSSASRAAS